MDRRVLTLCAAALSGLAACSTYDPYYSSTPTPVPAPAVSSAPAPTVVVAPAPVVMATPVSVAPGTVAYRAGYGVIESVSLVYQPRQPSASAGASVSNMPDPGPYRMTVRMDDGSLQSLVVDTRAFMIGDRVQLMSDGRVARL